MGLPFPISTCTNFYFSYTQILLNQKWAVKINELDRLD